LELVLSVAPADGSAGLPLTSEKSMLRLAGTYAEHGLSCLELRPATEQDIERLGSSWARRLGIPARREAWLLRVEK
jgi:hypothetical protein